MRFVKIDTRTGPQFVNVEHIIRVVPEEWEGKEGAVIYLSIDQTIETQSENPNDLVTRLNEF